MYISVIFSNSGYTGGATGPGSVAGGASGAASNGGVSTIESTKRGHPLKSFSVPGPPPTGGATPVNKHSKLFKFSSTLDATVLYV